jgi:hypothetical protein
MKKTIFIIFFSCIVQHMQAQSDHVRFDYDEAGNQILRQLCVNCIEVDDNGNPYSRVADIPKENDFKKFSATDELQYYPNPVKEELHLKWQATLDAHVTSISLYNASGKLIKTVDKQAKEASQNLSFQSYPSGLYTLVLLYNNGEEKVIKIIKQ